MRISAGLKFLLCLLLLAGARETSAASVTVFAAASLTDSLEKIAAQYERETHDKIVFNFAGSSLLARQIEEGAPADIFFSADEAQMDRLQNKGLILAGTRQSRLSNLLVIIVAADSSLSIAAPRDLAKPSVSRVALADPQAVPAGVYAREFLRKENLWAPSSRRWFRPPMSAARWRRWSRATSRRPSCIKPMPPSPNG
jgi:molybdate transport system substrate-binding protein